MKPVNLNKAVCNPISSNCVIWQGPNMPCINLCTGDSISNAVAALATELCNMLDQLKVENYDLTCFGIDACAPQDFNALIQFLIAQVCKLANPDTTTTATNNCPDCMVTVASCFIENGITSMNLVEYVNVIANKLCTTIDNIATINDTLTQYDIRITELEDAPAPTFTIPSVSAACVPGVVGSQPIDFVLNKFFNTFFCDFYNIVGTTTALGGSITPPCITFGSYDAAIKGSAGWISSPASVADSLKDIWIAICTITNTPPPVPAPGKSGRGVAVFVGQFSGVSPTLIGFPTSTDFQTEYGTQEGFGVNYISGNNQLKAGDIWISPCGE